MSGESSDDILIDDLDDEEAGSAGEDDVTEAVADTEAGIMNRDVSGAEQSATSEEATGSGQNQQAVGGAQTRTKKKRRVSRARERKISISSSRLKVSPH